MVSAGIKEVCKLKQKWSIKKRLYDLFVIIAYLIVWTVIAVIGQFCELWDVEYWVGIYVFLMPILIAVFSVLIMIGVRKKHCALYIVIMPLFFGVSYIGLQYATYGVRSLSVGNEFYANWIYPWTAVPAAFWSLIFIFIGVGITQSMKKFEDED